MPDQLDNDIAQKLIAVLQSSGGIKDPLKNYNGKMFLQHRPQNPFEPGVRINVLEPQTVFSSQGLVTQTNPISTNPEYFWSPTMPTFQ
jgi:hypothetical protein|tara:strand:- start:947 stop:1210 length:264 start_codon:yes stop_codon:yes gene_type:complete